MKKIFYLFFFLCLLPSAFCLFSCHCKKKVPLDAKTSIIVPRDFEKEGYVQATVINFTLDGCTFLLQLADGTKLEPTNLGGDFKKDQLAVWIKYIPKKAAASVCMAGQIVELFDIQLRN